MVTVEDHSIEGGLGGAVAEVLGELLPTPLKRLGVRGFGESGDPKGLYAKHGLDAGHRRERQEIPEPMIRNIWRACVVLNRGPAAVRSPADRMLGA